MAQFIESKTQLWNKRLRQFENSSLTVAEFCQSIGCSIPTFYQWRNKLQASKSALPKPAFLQVLRALRDTRFYIPRTFVTCTSNQPRNLSITLADT